MVVQNPAQGIHEHFYANGKRHTRILIAPKPMINFTDTSARRQSLCSAYSSSEIPLTHHLRQNSLLINDEQDEHFLTCRYQQSNGPRASSVTQNTSIMLLDSPSAIIKHNSALVSFVENMKNQQHDQNEPLLRSSTEKSSLGKSMKPYGLTDASLNSDGS